jgi:hypothetical protein
MAASLWLTNPLMKGEIKENTTSIQETVEQAAYLLATCDQFPYVMVCMCKRYKLQPNDAGDKHQHKA